MSTREPKTRGIPMSAALAIATLRDDKTQTRRVIDPQPPSTASRAINYSCGGAWDGQYVWVSGDTLADVEQISPPFRCPYGQPGDRLAMTEAHRWLGIERGSLLVRYEADGERRLFPLSDLRDDIAAKARAYTRWGKLRASRFLHHQLSRALLEVLAIRAERVQDISEADALAEGVGCKYAEGGGDAREWLQHTWDSINAARGHGWDVNDWVWAITYRRLAESGGA